MRRSRTAIQLLWRVLSLILSKPSHCKRCAIAPQKAVSIRKWARPMARLIQDTIRKALADELLFGKLVGGGKVAIDIDEDGKVKLAFPETDAPQEPAETATA
jgi:C-terminal, D2-small domain, of ClpB protein